MPQLRSISDAFWRSARGSGKPWSSLEELPYSLLRAATLKTHLPQEDWAQNYAIVIHSWMINSAFDVETIPLTLAFLEDEDVVRPSKLKEQTEMKKMH